ncbi:MAG: EpsI family protein [Proteobacteria bacterium]|nr:EpsI family protein [Pseudomonadota bacterium]MBU1388711.1 EpsI family protein [Pseudomonadota bacterium]MBU1543052.1 EpsI family protein [Pseudomonadota bacterium]MBU2431763.1 EpsI family protein [Pseudomonadota bacterium]MBU2482826.1 EpsI family protein [Pseudomonadota bacterium]
MKTNQSFIITLVILVMTSIGILVLAQRGTPVVVQTNLENLPMEILGYTGTEDFFDKSIYEELNADGHVYRHYRSGDGRQVDLYIGYYGTAKGGRTPHNPYACLPGAGWGIIRNTTVKLTRNNSDDVETVNFITSRKGEVYDVVYHWYQSDGDKVLSNGIEQNIQRFVGRILQNRNDGAFVRVSSITSKDRLEQTNEMVKNFSQEMLRLLPEYWPVEADSQ